MNIKFYELSSQIRLKSDSEGGYRFASGVKTKVEADKLIVNLFVEFGKLVNESLHVKVTMISNIKVIKTDTPSNGYRATVHYFVKEKSEMTSVFIRQVSGDRSYGFNQLFDQLQEVALTLHHDFQEIVHLRITPLNEMGEPIKFEL